MAKKAKRLTFEESWAHLKKKKLMDLKGTPILLDHHAGWDRKGDPTDINFFRSRWEGADLSNLTLPRRYINRSDIQVNFSNTDLSQSFMCWNDFIGCDFTDADLTCCDMRRSVFRNCTFVRCRLVAANLCQSEFENCDFTGADTRGVIIDDETEFDLPEEEWDPFLRVMEVIDEAPQPKGG